MTSENDLIPFHTPGDAITAIASGAVTGKRLVAIAGAAEAGQVKVAKCGAGNRAFGVAARDKADGATVLVWRPDGGIYPVTAGDAIDANTPLASDADGKVVPAGPGDVVVAWALDDAAEDEDAMVELVKGTQADDSGVAGGQASITALTDNSGGAAGNNTIAAIPLPADTPASADALRDDIAANVVPAIRDAIADLAAKQNEVIATLDAAGITA